MMDFPDHVTAKLILFSKTDPNIEMCFNINRSLALSLNKGDELFINHANKGQDFFKINWWLPTDFEHTLDDLSKMGVLDNPIRIKRKSISIETIFIEGYLKQ